TADPRLQVVQHHLTRMAPTSGSGEWPPAGSHLVDAALRQRWQEMQETTDEVLVLIQSGMAAIFAGENEAAAYAFERVRDHGQAAGDRTARLLGIAGMLTAKAIHGEADRALELLEDPELADLVSGGE